MAVVLAGAAAGALGAEAVVTPAEPGQVAAEEHHGLSTKADTITTIGKFPITNSMLVTWVVALGVIIFAQIATKNMKAVPEGAQNFWEWMVESLYDFLAGIIGADLVKKTFWLFTTIFIFILFTNWFGLIPGVPRGPAVAARWQCGPEHDVRDGRDFHGAVVDLGIAFEWHLGVCAAYFRSQG